MDGDSEMAKERQQLNLEKLKKYEPTLIGIDRCHRSAVCIPLVETPDGYSVLFEVRSPNIMHQPGDICFPGGMIEDGEQPEDAAVRETGEELLLPKERIQLLGPVDILFTGGLLVYPFAAVLKEYEGTYSESEVAETFLVPLSFFLETEPEIYRAQVQVMPGEDFPFDKIQGGRDYNWRKRREEMLFYHYGEHSIWGITAKIMRAFVKIYREYSL